MVLCYMTKVKENLQLYLVPTDEGEYLNIAFSDTDDFTYVRSEPDENSDWTGKLYKDSTVEVLEYLVFIQGSTKRIRQL